MLIQTKYHGEVKINKEEIIRFEKGIPGFLEMRDFVILPLSDDGAFGVMQSMEESQLGFVVTNPYQFIKDYDFTLEEAVVEEIELESENDIAVYSILTVQEPFEKTTANLQAPVIVNVKNNKAKQVILTTETYKIKHSIFGTVNPVTEGVK